MAQHTPGPWLKQPKYVERGKYAGHVMVIAQNGGKITCIPKGPRDDVNEANARLIAAAPALLDALKDALEELHHPGAFRAVRDQSIVEHLNAVISAATGEDRQHRVAYLDKQS